MEESDFRSLLRPPHRTATGLRAGVLISLLVHGGTLFALTHWGHRSLQLPRLVGNGTVFSIAAPDSAAGFESVQPPAVEITTHEFVEPTIEIQPTHVIIAERHYELSPPRERFAPPENLLEPLDLPPVETSPLGTLPAPTELTEIVSTESPATEPQPSPAPNQTPTDAPSDATSAENETRAEPLPDIPTGPLGGAPSRASAAETPGDNAQIGPNFVFNPPPDYPVEAQQRHWQGTVLLRFQVTAAGRVADLEILTSSGHELLDAAAIRAVRQWVFQPARQAGHAVAVTVRLPVRFRLP
jgi:protein TonB